MIFLPDLSTVEPFQFVQTIAGANGTQQGNITDADSDEFIVITHASIYVQTATNLTLAGLYYQSLTYRLASATTSGPGNEVYLPGSIICTDTVPFLWAVVGTGAGGSVRVSASGFRIRR